MKKDDDIRTIKGIGDKTAELFKKLNVITVEQLCSYFPRDYKSYSNPDFIADAKIGVRGAVRAQIATYAEVKKVRNLTLTIVDVMDSTGKIRITWYNQPYLKSIIKKGDSYVFVGIIVKKNGGLYMDAPEYYRLGDYAGLMQVMQPVYALTKGLSNKTVQKAVKSCKIYISGIQDFIPDNLRVEYNLMHLPEAIMNMHYPKDIETLKSAVRRIAFNEFYRFISDINLLRRSAVKRQNTHRIMQGRAVADFVERLPFGLTKGQSEAIDDILLDMGSENVMNRLIQGDVGSGKTVVAQAAVYACVKEGWQAAVMVPTEVLARQHLESFREAYKNLDIRVELLSGSTSMKDKRLIYEGLAEGSIDLIIGTHALIQDKVVFNKLALAVTDEQHRFGVNQREMLSEKGDYPHTLVMSATPIPRTLAIILYADMDISVINQMPTGRKAIKNCVVDIGYRPAAYKFIKQQVEEGSQAYIICPMVDEGDNTDVTNVIAYTDVMREALGESVSVATIHGHMKNEQKNQIMQGFISGTIDVLVSTTVIEVGINNPNATVMMVENSERFGLAQLHQLRGRVGRGNKQSYCIFVSGNESEECMKRLTILKDSNDGFYIAGEDLKLRGPGDFFGIRQSGDIMFSVADIYNHADMLKIAQQMYEQHGSEILLDTSNIMNPVL